MTLPKPVPAWPALCLQARPCPPHLTCAGRPQAGTLCLWTVDPDLCLPLHSPPHSVSQGVSPGVRAPSLPSPSSCAL